MMKKYTVLMIATNYIGTFPTSYMAHVEAVDVEQAEKLAQVEAAAPDPDDVNLDRPEDFFVVFVCEGHVEDIKLW